MSPLTPEARSARARLAALKRHRGPEADVTNEADQLEQARIDQHIAAVVKSAPRMTAEQADRLRRLFTYGPTDEGGAVG